MRRSIVFGWLVVGVVATLTACAQASVTSTDDGLAFATYAADEPGVGDSAILNGQVEDTGGCVTITENDSDLVYTPVFPTSSSSARQLVVGDEVELRGGAHDDLSGIPDVQVPDSCSSDGPIWLVVDDA